MKLFTPNFTPIDATKAFSAMTLDWLKYYALPVDPIKGTDFKYAQTRRYIALRELRLRGVWVK